MNIRVAFFAFGLVLAALTAAPAVAVDGQTEACDNFQIQLLPILGDIIEALPVGFDTQVEIPDEGWVWISPSTDKFRSVYGVVLRSHVASNDLQANHDSHDQNTVIIVDPGLEDMLSPANAGELHIEWETGISPHETSGDGSRPTFPRWAWPSPGDRVWAEGHWIYDCGHESGGLYYSEIHPPRAMAAMRNQARPLPGSGSTPVLVTAVDLYVHGRGGYAVEQLNCGMSIILDLDFTQCPIHTTPIDTDFEFDVCVPPRPFGSAELVWTVDDGPGNTIGIAPEIRAMAVPDGHACRLTDADHTADFDDQTMLHVRVPLAGSGVADVETYARHIDAGWVFPSDPPLRHFALGLEFMDLHDDHDPELFEPPTINGEMSFFWMNLPAAANEWERLSDFDVPTGQDCTFPCGNHENKMEEFDDDHNCCFGNLNFAGPNFDLYVRNDAEFEVRTNAYEQDCVENYFGVPYYTVFTYVDCYVGSGALTFNAGRSDDVATFGAVFRPPDYAMEVVHDADGEFEMDFGFAEIPLSDEDTSSLAVTKSCSFAGEVPLAGEPLTCTVEVANGGPGLPRDTRLADEVSGAGSPLDYVVASPTYRFGSSSFACEIVPSNEFECNLGSVPVGGAATIDVQVTPGVPGAMTNTAYVVTDSTETDPDDDEDSVTLSIYLGVEVDVKPVGGPGVLRIGSQQRVAVTVLTTPEFDATTIDPASACFGDAEAPAERTCREIHGKAHFEDVDHDRDKDFVMHFQLNESGIDLGDTQACLIGATLGGIGIYGCDGIETR